MEEAEALCTKMGIMVNGELKCLGRYIIILTIIILTIILTIIILY